MNDIPLEYPFVKVCFSELDLWPQPVLMSSGMLTSTASELSQPGIRVLSPGIPVGFAQGIRR